MAADAPQFEIYENTEGWQWRLRATNGEIVAEGRQGYVDRSECVNMQELLMLMLEDSVIEEVDA